MTVRQLLTNADSRELSEWMAYFEIENEKLKSGKGAEDNNTKNVETKIKGAFSVFGGVKHGYDSKSGC
jgi:hypothetical protein